MRDGFVPCLPAGKLAKTRFFDTKTNTSRYSNHPRRPTTRLRLVGHRPLFWPTHKATQRGELPKTNTPRCEMASFPAYRQAGSQSPVSFAKFLSAASCLLRVTCFARKRSYTACYCGWHDRSSHSLGQRCTTS